MSTIRKIVYVSSAVPKLSDSQLEHIVTQSRLANDARGVTGLLVYGDGSIMQVLEGSHDETGNLFEQIRNDPRHRDVIKIFDIPADSRDFDAWNMACARSIESQPIDAMIDLKECKPELYAYFNSLDSFGPVLANMVERIARAT